METQHNNYTVCKRFHNLIPFLHTYHIKTVGVDDLDNKLKPEQKIKQGKKLLVKLKIRIICLRVRRCRISYKIKTKQKEVCHEETN